MEQLTIVGAEGLRLVLATEQGQRFTLDIDDMLRTEVRKARAEAEPKPREAGPSPREIQAHIRSGMAAEQVAELLSCDIERVRLFEGPVLAEREHIVGRALAMPVLTGVRIDQDENPTFGTAIRQKLTELSATNERWTSWKEDEGWVIKLTFVASSVDHDARWTFDPRRSALAPANDDATQLSRQGKMPDGLIPRLRALDVVADEKDSSTFDEKAFHEDAPVPTPEPERTADTADLLEALRRKRGQREVPPALHDDDEHDESAPRGPQRPVAMIGAIDPRVEETPPADDAEDNANENDDDTSVEESDARAKPSASESAKRRGRPAMPSWDEIVFGARGDD
ncbi:septation protein SepH [Microbacterium sp. G2-8]|uniref:septation protein SepH n=1 Tax=Microbacterium sp. G2-8 TaxID=2842454 RepID=UPI001C89B616|nr:septation protein SepH [Microbacterium sp. G2-8]